MAKLPDYTDLGERPAPRPPLEAAQYYPHTRLEGEAANFTYQTANNLGQTANILEAMNAKQDQVAAEDAYNKLQIAKQNLEFDPNKGFRNVQGSAAIGQEFFKNYQDQFQTATDGIADSLTNDRQKQLFQQRADIANLQYRSSLLQHQAIQTQQFAQTTAENTINVEMRNIAANPTSDVIFNTGMARIKGTIEDNAIRLNQPPALTEEQKAHAIDTAWTTRIKTVLTDNPYVAEKMFRDNYLQLGPASRIVLQNEITRDIKLIQQRNIAQNLIYGSKVPTDPQQIYPAIKDEKPLEGVVQKIESNNQRYDKQGNLLTSVKGAQGEMQVMPETAVNPGYGVTPAKDNSPEELARVGKDYLGAMTARYNDPVLVLAAYNAGPAQVDQWIGKYGDPRTGQISTQDFISKIPFAETKNYVTKGLKLINAQTDQPQAPISAPTAKELKTQLPQYIDTARNIAQRMYPNDPIFADGVASRVATYGNTIVAQQDAQQGAARDMLTRGLIGSQPDGSDKPATIDALLTDPRMKDAWNQATPEVQLAIQNHFKNGEPPRTPQSTALFYQYLGKFSNDRDGFANEDLTPLITQLPYSDFHNLAEMQVRAKNKIDSDADKQANMIHALSIAMDYALKPIGINMPTKDTPQSKRDLFDQFTGAYRQEIDKFQTENKRPPNDADLISMAKNLTATVQIKGGKWFGFGDKDIRAFEINPQNEGQVYSKNISPEFRQGITQALRNATGGKEPTEAQIQTAYILSLRQPGKSSKRNQVQTAVPVPQSTPSLVDRIPP